MIESNDQEWGLCDHYPDALEIDDEDAEADYGDAWDEFDEDDDDEWPMAHMARVAADIEAGRAEVPRGWKLDRPGPGILVWTTPSGQRYASTLTGEWLPVPAIRP
jgi:hypothetical protein